MKIIVMPHNNRQLQFCHNSLTGDAQPSVFELFGNTT
jgi:hypothetical protein